jgi:hypothetical protein
MNMFGVPKYTVNNHQRKQELPCTYAYSPWTGANPGHKLVRPVPKTGQTGSTKPVRPVTKIGQTDFIQQTTPSKAKYAKEMHNLPLDSWDRF